MLVPNKYMSFKTSIVNISASIIEILSKQNSSDFSYVLNNVIKKHGLDSKYEFINALDFLFLLGTLDYDSKSDSLRLIL